MLIIRWSPKHQSFVANMPEAAARTMGYEPNGLVLVIADPHQVDNRRYQLEAGTWMCTPLAMREGMQKRTMVRALQRLRQTA